MIERARFTWLIPFLGVLAAIGPLSNDLYIPSLSLVETGLDVPAGSAQLTMSSLLIGVALGCLIYGPLGDRYGRKPVLCTGLVIYVFAAALAASAEDLGVLIAARALQGLGGASAMVLTRAIILDRWVLEEASKALSWIAIFTFLTPVIAPLIGGYIASLGRWQTVFWTQAGAGAVCLLVTATSLPRVRRATAQGLLQSIGAYRRIVGDRQTLGYMLCTGLGFIGLIAFVTNSSFVFVNYYGLEPYQFGFCFSAVMLGASLGAYTNSRFVSQLGIPRMIGFGSGCLGTGGLSALVSVMLGGGMYVLLASIMVYMYGISFVFANSMAHTMSRFRENASAASAVFGVNQFLIGGIVAAFLSLESDPSPLPLIASMATAGAACALVWWGWLRRAYSR